MVYELKRARGFKTLTKAICSIKRAIFAPKLKVLGYDYSKKEEFLVHRKRTLVVTQLAGAGDPAYI